VTNNELKVGLRDRILRRAEQFGDEVILMAMFDLLLSKPQSQLLIDSLPVMASEQQGRLFDRLLGLDELPQVKFDNVIRVLSKQYEAERLCRFVLKAAQNGFKLNENGVPLSLPDKLKLIHTAECVLGDSKGLDSNT